MPPPPRTHYAGYISINENDILFYDGIPSSKPLLQKYQMTTIGGDISLLCYFPLNSLTYNRDMVSKDEGNCVAHKKLKSGNENAIPTKWIESSVLLKQKEKLNFC